MRVRGAFALALALLALAPAAAGAQTITFGANLNREPNVSVNCTQVPFTNFTYPSGFTSCSWSASGRFMDSTEAFGVPSGEGVLTAARVRTGPNVGPMRVDVLSTLRSPLSTIASCCKHVAASPVFTPAPNSITTIPLNIPVINGPTVTGVLEFNTIAITMLTPAADIPLHFTGDWDTLSGPGAGAMYPAINIGQERSDVAGTFGYQVLMNADWVPRAPTGTGPDGGGPGGTVPSTGPPQVSGPVGPVAITPVVSLGTQSRIPVRSNAALVELLCGQNTACQGILRLQNQAAAVGAPKLSGAAVRTYGSRSFSLKPGQKRRIKTKLGRVGKSTLKRRKRLRAYVNLEMGGTKMTLGRVTLTR